MMKLTAALFMSGAMLAISPTPVPADNAPLPAPPPTPKVPHVTEIHGIKLTDEYFWLREKKNPEVLKHLEAENAYTETVMAPTKPLQEKLYKEMLARIKQTDLSVPSRIGNYFYYSRTQ